MQDSDHLHSLAGWLVNSWQNQVSGFSASPHHPAGQDQSSGNGGEGQPGEDSSEAGTAPDPYAELSREELASVVLDRDGALSASVAEVS